MLGFPYLTSPVNKSLLRTKTCMTIFCLTITSNILSIQKIVCASTKNFNSPSLMCHSLTLSFHFNTSSPLWWRQVTKNAACVNKGSVCTLPLLGSWKGKWNVPSSVISRLTWNCSSVSLYCFETFPHPLTPTVKPTSLCCLNKTTILLIIFSVN